MRPRRAALMFALALALASACARKNQNAAPRSTHAAIDAVPSIIDLVRADRYEVTAKASSLPADVRAALTREFGTSKFEMASEDERYSSGCLYEPGLPRQRLLLAAVSPRFAIVHFETGGFAIAQNVRVFKRSAENPEAEKIHANFAGSAWSERRSFLSAIRSGELFIDRSAKALVVGT